MEDYESHRHELYTNLERVLGERSAGTLMTSLPPKEWADLATKADLDAGLVSVRKGMAAEFKLVRTELRGDIARQGTDLRAEIAQQGAELRAEIAQQGAELRAEFGELRTEVVELRTKVDAGFELMDKKFELVRKDFSALSHEVSNQVHKALLDLSLRLFLSLAGLIVSIVALAFTAAHLLKA